MSRKPMIWPSKTVKALWSYLNSAELKFQLPCDEFSATWRASECIITWKGDLDSASFQVTLDGNDITPQFFVSTDARAYLHDLTVGSHTLTVTAKVGIPIWIPDDTGDREVDMYRQLTDTVQFAVQDLSLSVNPQLVDLSNLLASNSADLTISVDRQGGGFEGDVYVYVYLSLPSNIDYVSYTPDFVIKEGQTSGTFTLSIPAGINIGGFNTYDGNVRGHAYLPDAHRGSGYDYASREVVVPFTLRITGIY